MLTRVFYRLRYVTKQMTEQHVKSHANLTNINDVNDEMYLTSGIIMTSYWSNFFRIH